MITYRKGNALDLSVFADNTSDITLLLGLMYHLYMELFSYFNKLIDIGPAVIQNDGPYLFLQKKTAEQS